MHENEQLLRDYWATIERDQDYTAISGFYAADALLVDPIYGPFEGIERIRGFLQDITAEMRKAGITFSVAETAADGGVGWSRWLIHLPGGGEKEGVSVCRFRDGKIVYQRDYIGSRELT